MEQRLTKLEDGLHGMELRVQKVETQISTTSRDVDHIERNAGKAIWLVFASIIAAVMGFVLNGGLTNGGR